MAQRIWDPDITFFRGMKSDADPGGLPLGYYWSGINVLNVGGTVGCRPGMRCLVNFPEGKLQGSTIFRPRLGLDQMVVAVDGTIYVADYPFKNFRQLPNVKMSSFAKQMFWAQTEQSAQRLTPNDVASAIEVIPPRNVLFIQDGGSTAPIAYDGSTAMHVRDNLYETPSGSAMRWIGDRLWVAVGALVFASDIANPFSFREQQYLGGTAAFTFNGDVTAMAVTPSLEFPQLLVFTEQDTTLIQADIRERTSWVSTPGFQRVIFKVGCTSQRSVVGHYGQLTWYSPSGIVFFDAAALSKQQARLPLRDGEMTVSKTTLSDDLSLVAGAAFGQYALMSVPAEDSFNKHTHVLNSASYQTLVDDSGPSWASIWIGTRPVEWVYGVIAGAERCYHVSADEDGQNRLWECFLPERLDNGCPITWAVQTRGYFGVTSQQKPAGLNALMCWAEIALTAISQDTDIAVSYAGGLRGAYKRIMTKTLHVSRGCFHSPDLINGGSRIFGFKSQSRIIRTEEVRLLPVSAETGSCPVERDIHEQKDESFQLLIVGQGPGTIRYIRAFAQPELEDQSANGEACQNEQGDNAVRFDGAGAHGDSWQEVDLALQNRPLIAYESNQTAQVSQGGMTVVGVGHADSIISQEAADRVAHIVATKAAESELERSLPPILSLGEGL